MVPGLVQCSPRRPLRSEGLIAAETRSASTADRKIERTQTARQILSQIPGRRINPGCHGSFRQLPSKVSGLFPCTFVPSMLGHFLDRHLTLLALKQLGRSREARCPSSEHLAQCVA